LAAQFQLPDAVTVGQKAAKANALETGWQAVLQETAGGQAATGF
jgi:hypothetical protein